MSRRNNQGPSVPRKPDGAADERLRIIDILAKARSMADSTVEESEALNIIQALNQNFANMNAVVPRYDPESLLRYIELTPHLRPSIDAMAQNVDGFGFHAEPIKAWMKNLDSEEATQAIREALEIEQWVTEEEEALEAENEKRAALDKLQDAREKLDAAEAKGHKPRTLRKWERAVAAAQDALDGLEVEEPEDGGEPAEDEGISDEQVNETREMLRMQLRRESYLFDAWFKNCCSDRSFVQLRRDVREDIKSHGWGSIEFLRDGYGRLKRLNYIPGFTVRPLVERGDLVDVPEDDSVTPLSQDREVMVKRRFQIYVQIVGGSRVYFKSPGDPRVVSKDTGKVYKDERALRRPKDAEPPGEGPKAEPANELLYLAAHDPTTPCPPPVWIGNLVSVLGGREADETNYFYLRDKALPAGLLFVNGGRVPKGTKNRLESRIKNELAGARGSGKLLVVEAQPIGKSPNDRTVLPSLEFQSLREAHTNDALFTQYDERTADRVGASFRLSPLLRGYTPSNLNRATAYATMEFAEQQVFQPEREEFDWIVDRYVMAEIGLRFTKFVSNSPPTRSAEEVGKLIHTTAPHGAWTPNDAREAVGEVMNKEFAKFDEPWADMPMVLTLSGATPAGEAEDPMTQGELSELNKRLRQIESRVASIVTEEMRALGYDMETTAAFVDPPEGEDGED